MSTNSLPTVAIAGATGSAGKPITSAFLSLEFRSKFKNVILLTRQTSSKDRQDKLRIPTKGAVIREYSEDKLTEALDGVDIVVNAIGSAGPSFKEALLRAVTSPSSNVTLYFPSELGVDHTLSNNKDLDFNHPEWNKKKAHIALAKELIPASGRDIKVCSVYVGLMTELSIGPWFGLDTNKARYEAIGSADSPVTFTCLDDIGKAIAVLASMPIKDVPEQIRIAGDSVSVREIAKIMTDAGAPEIEIETVKLDGYKEKALKGSERSPAEFLRFLMGEGKIDFSKKGLGNGDEVVNPGEKNWKWKTMKDYAVEEGGRPWADS